MIVTDSGLHIWQAPTPENPWNPAKAHLPEPMGYEDLRSRMAEAGAPNVVEKGRAAVRRATIEAKALRHGVKVGIRVARRVSRRTKATKA